jgi:hypothetical protein
MPEHPKPAILLAERDLKTTHQPRALPRGPGVELGEGFGEWLEADNPLQRELPQGQARKVPNIGADVDKRMNAVCPKAD